jgi:hypothetical protein
MGAQQDARVDVKDLRWLHVVMRLLEAYPTASPQGVLGFVLEAHQSVQSFGLTEREDIHRSEQIARELLAQWSSDKTGPRRA